MVLEFIVISPAGPRGAYKSPSLAIAAARAGAIGILDLEYVSDAKAALEAVIQLQTHSMGGTIGIRAISGRLPFDSENSNIDRLAPIDAFSQAFKAEAKPIICFTPGQGDYDPEILKREISRAKSVGFKTFAEAINLAEAKLLAACGVDAVIAKGHESGGRIGDTTTFVLVQQCLRHLQLPIFAQGGIGPNTAAAIAAAGGAGVVLDSQLYLCRDSLIPKDVKLKLQRLDGTETSVIHAVKCEQSQFRLLWHSSRAGHERESELKDVSSLEQFISLNINAQTNSETEFWIVGQDACFAKSLAETGGTVSGVLEYIRNTVKQHIEIAANSNVLSDNSPLAQFHGTAFPIVQGAMTRVSDTSEFALRVAEGGALPFLALSLIRGADVEKLLTETAGKLGKRPWGVGVLGFVPPQLWQEQMEVIKKIRPPFALVAGGRPDQAKALEERGIKTYLHVPSPLLMKSFIEQGCKRFIFEGRECGGHIGPRSSFVLWESMIQVILESVGPKDKPETYQVLFAGGVHDDLSAAMVAALSAPLTARGINVGVLIGTAYLFTKEAVDSGAIVPKFQEAAIACDDTVLLETGPGHSIRCVSSPYKQTFDRHRQELQQKGISREGIREELELTNLGRLRIASKGITRVSASEFEELSEDKQWQEGMYMIGQVASLHNKVTTIIDLHKTISEGGTTILNRLVEPVVEVTKPEQTPQESIAIVGMSCMFPKSNDVETFWQNILNKVDTIIEVPASHFDVQKFYDPDPLARDKIVSKWGGFIEDVVFEPAPHGIPPSSLDFVDAMQLLVLEAAKKALADAGYEKRKLSTKKTSVILANAGHGPITAFYSLRSMLDWKFESLNEQDREYVKRQLPEWSEDSFAGYLGNVTAGRVANRLDLKGVNFAIDAACASSLAAVYVAIGDLRAGRSDVVLLGATDTHNQPGDYLSFSKTHALSPRGRCQTFDQNADGIVISEGVAMLILKRLTDAERDGDRIYAVIRGIGGSSDGRALSLTAPRPEGQALALERAYEDACVSPHTVELIEAHGTGTVAGDKAEVEALTRVFEKAGAETANCAIGSVKTNIGHTKAAAGLASMIKVAKSLHHKILPPTINVTKPNAACKFGEGPFYLSSDIRPWMKAKESEPRRAGISAFGFGGTNFHAVLEEYVPAFSADQKPAIEAWPAELFVWRVDSKESLLKAVAATEAAVNQIHQSAQVETAATSNNQRRLFDLAFKLQSKLNDLASWQCALSIVASSTADLLAKIAKVKEKLSSSAKTFSMPGGIHFFNRMETSDCSDGKVAFLFPGQGSQRVDMLKELSLYFSQIRENIEGADRHLRVSLDRRLTSYIYPIPTLSDETFQEQQKRLTATEIAQPALAACDLAILKLLREIGVAPDMVAGHSFGEYVALHCAGVIGEQQLLDLSAQRGRILADCAKRTPGAMAAVSAGAQQVTDILAGVHDVYLANINAPQQCIISGAVAGIESSIALLKTKGVTAKVIPVSAPFHSPLMESAKQPLMEALSRVEYSRAHIPVFSNTTASQYVTSNGAMPELLTEHALKPVRFAQQIRAMHEAGARIFVEVGPGAVLTGLVESTLQGEEFLTVSLERAKNSLPHFLNGLGCLFARGVIKNIGSLFYNRLPDLVEQAPAAPTEDKNRLLYRVNSVKIEKIGPSKSMDEKQPQPKLDVPSNGKRDIAGFAQAPAKPLNGNNGFNPAALTRNQVPSNLGSADDSVERMMLEFQKSLLDITDRFLQSQENLMQSYLQAKAGGLSGNQAALSTGLQFDQSALINNVVSPQEGEFPLQGNEQNGNGIESGAVSIDDSVSNKDAGDEGTLDTESLIDSLFEIVSERTGYPRDMLDPTLDLEADLGIDSIKRVEILNNLRKLLPQATQEKLESGIEKLAVTRTLQGIIEWLRALDTTGEENALPASVDANENVARGLVAVKVLESPVRTKKPLPRFTLIVGDHDEQAEAVGNALHEIGQESVVMATGSLLAGLQEVRKKHGTIGSVIYLTESSPDQSALKVLFRLAQAVESDLNNTVKQGQRASFICRTSLGGDFGVQNLDLGLEAQQLADQAGIVGMVKTIAKEWPDVHVKVVDLPGSLERERAAKILADELIADDDVVEIGLCDGKRIGLEIVQSPFASSTEELTEQFDLTPSSVVLVTGGARGITAEIILDIARRNQPTFIIVGRIPRPAETESPLTAGLETAKDIKAAIISELRAKGEPTPVRDVERSYQQLLREREVRNTLAALKAAGSTVRYYSVDVSDEKTFEQFIDTIYETSNIDGIIHGAGLIEDAYIKDKKEESFDRVFNTKVVSALTLARKVRFENLQFMYFFSSVVGRTGNAGQCDYVAANEALNKLALHITKKTEARVASIMWGPWQAGMAPPELEAVFASHGWSMIKPVDGRVCFYEELRRNLKDEVEVLLVGKLKQQSKAPQTAVPTQQISAPVETNGKPIVPAGLILDSAELASHSPPRFTLTIKTNEHRYLDDHKFDGIPVMPMAVALEMMLEAGQSIFPDRQLTQISSLDIPAGIVFHTDKKDFLIDAIPQEDGRVSLVFKSAGKIEKPHFRCSAKFDLAPQAVPETLLTQKNTRVPRVLEQLPPSKVPLPDPQGLYGTWLFHGPLFQGVTSVDYLAPDGVSGRIRTSVGQQCVSTAAPNRSWILDPVLLDSAMQLAGIWARHNGDITVLPTGFRSMQLFAAPLTHLKGAIARVYITSEMAMELACDLAMYDENGQLIAIIEGLGGIASKAFNRFSSQSNVPQVQTSPH